MKYNKIFKFDLALNNYLWIVVFVGVLFMPVQLFAAYNHVIISSSDLPYSAKENDSITFATSKITTTGNGIYVNANNVFINLQNDTLEFGTNYSDNVYGIYTGYNKSGLTITGNPASDNGGLILHGGGTGISDSSWDCSNIMTRGGMNYVTIQDVDMEIYGWDGHNYRQFGSIDNLEISGGKVITHNDGFTSRCSFDASSMYIKSGVGDNARIHDIVFDTWHDGIFFEGKVSIYNCSLYVDAKNDLYWPGDDDDNFCHTSALSAGITAWVPGAGSEIYDNYIKAGIENEGCEQGIAMNYAEGTYTDSIKVYRNTAILHRGPDDHYGGITCKGYKQRWGNKYVSVFENEFYLYAHADSGAHAAAYGRAVEGFEMLWIDAAHGSEGPFCDSFITISNNHVEAIALSENCTAAGARITIRGELTGYNWQTAGNIWKNNYFKSSNVGLDLGKSDGGPCYNFLTIGDTLEAGGTTSSYHTFELGDWGGPSKYNIARDLVYLGGASDKDIYWDPSSNANGSDLALEKTIQIYVEGNNGLAVVNAACSLWNVNNQLVVSDFTNYRGIDTAVVRYYHAFKSSPDIDYNDFFLKINKDDAVSSRNININNLTSTIVVNLNIAGNGDTTIIDSIPPAPILDLKAGQ